VHDTARLRLLGVLAVVLLLVAGLATYVLRTSDKSAGSAARSRPAAAVAAPKAPDGMRFVGVGRAVVAVPESWPVYTQVCATPHEDHVFFDSDASASARCAFSRPGRTVAVGVGTLNSQVGAVLLDPLAPTDLLKGEEVRQDKVVCAGSAPLSCSQTFAVVPERAFFTVTARGAHPRAAVRRIRDSLAQLPVGWTTVPFVTYGASDDGAVNAMTAVGLLPVLPDVDSPHYVVGSDPFGGSPVEVGAEVRVLVGDG
jgi:hypothetical protein